ncbi:hypothetical protein GCM10010289_71370 [Streptomyces violascens]|nr:hypothetical protein GCM10010289_71370 [Streptomyces violascens]
MTRQQTRPDGEAAVKAAIRLIASNALGVQNAYPGPGARPAQCARALRRELAEAPYALRLIVNRRDAPASTPAAYMAGVLASLEAHPDYLAFEWRATRADDAELIVVRRGAVGSDYSPSAQQEARRKDNCPSGKVLYHSAGQAEGDAARLAAASRQLPNTAYHCSLCGWWHRTSRM